ncbi:MAG: hypothetical protein AAF441_22665 [Pseudomonadota bacterium]
MGTYLTNEHGVEAAHLADLAEPRDQVELGLSEFAGTWINADAATPGLAKVECAIADGRLAVRAFGAGEDGLLDWGEAQDLEIYGTTIAANEGNGISGRYVFPHLETAFQANLKGGVMVAVTYNRFTDGSGRRPYFMREFLTLDVAP